MNKPTSKAVMDQVAKLREAGITTQDVAEILRETYANVSRIYGAYKRAEAGDIDGLNTTAYSRNVREWAAARFSLNLEPKPEPVLVPAVQPGTLPMPPKPDNTAAAIVSLLTKADRAVDLLEKVLLAIEANGQRDQKTQQVIYGLASTMHNEAADLKKAMNANADMISKDLVQSRDHLQQIRSNTKK